MQVHGAQQSAAARTDAAEHGIEYRPTLVALGELRRGFEERHASNLTSPAKHDAQRLDI